MKPIIKRLTGSVLLGLALTIILAACNYPAPDLPRVAASEAPTQDEISSSPTASPTPTPTPPKILAVCLWQEPESLFVYGDASTSARAVRQAIYDGPYDIVNYAIQPVILQKVPSLADGDARLEPVEVKPGDTLVDSGGNLNLLSEGVIYLPSGCRDASCALSYTGSEPVTMDQLAVRFGLREGVLWSDGAPITARDSVYSFEVAQALYPQVQADLLQRTSDYQALDERSVEWRGIPGYLDPLYARNFFHPLPEHAWKDIPARQLADSEEAGRMPLGWGAYSITEWVAGDHIALEKNPQYFRAGQGLPAFDRLVFRFVPETVDALTALAAGECDLIDEAAPDTYNPQDMRPYLDAGRLALNYELDTAWEHLDFGIQHSDATAPAFFQVKEVRQAVAQCIDRQQIVQALFPDQSQVMHTYAPSANPLFNPQARQYLYDPAAGAALLQAAGWIDLDNDPNTPRVAQAVPGVLDATPFQVDFLTQDTPERQQVAELIKNSLAQCGIEVDIRYLQSADLFAPGPDGQVFGRQFDLAQFGWEVSLEPPCDLYTTRQIPGPYPQYPMGWGGANASGYSQPEYDALCATARNSLMDDPVHQEAHLQAQSIFAEDLPVLPLYSRFRLVAARPDLCGLQLDPLADGIFWNIEGMNYGEGCQGE
jgi:peptide/nickel transport system substrate-binding protein